MKIKAVGLKENKVVSVTAEWRVNRWVYSTKPKSQKLLNEFQRVVAERHPIGGTYYPREKEPTYVIAAMSGPWFFDKGDAIIETDEEFETIPSENGVVY